MIEQTNTINDIPNESFPMIRSDLRRYKNASLSKILGNTAIWAISGYRLGRWVYHGDCPRLLKIPLKALYLIHNKLIVELLLDMHLDPGADIGKGLFIGHTGGVHINPGATIGENCDIAHQVTIGTSANGRKGAPTIGDQVYIGAGAKVIGKVTIGDNVKIAANSLVMSRIPAGATVMGVPAQIIMRGE